MSTKTIEPKEFVEGKLPQLSMRGMIPKLTRAERYSGKSSASYYNEQYAKAVLPHLIDMIKTRQDKEFLKDRFSTLETVYQRVQQSVAYCIDKMDEGDVLETLRQQIVIRKTDKSIVVCFIENADRYSKQALIYNARARNDAFIIRNALSVNWREKVAEFTEDMDKKELFINDGFALTAADIAETQSLCELMPEGCEIEVVKLTQNVIHLKRK